MLTFISFATPKYWSELDGLQESARRQGIVVDELRLMQEFQSWDDATRFKATYIESQLRERATPVCWIDADARFRKYPEMLYDLAATQWIDIAVHYRCDDFAKKRVGPAGELLSGTVLFRPTSQSFGALTRWQELNKSCNRWEQYCLQDAIRESEGLLNVYKLPAEYCMITVPPYPCQMGTDEQAIIAHTQASRRLR